MWVQECTTSKYNGLNSTAIHHHCTGNLCFWQVIFITCHIDSVCKLVYKTFLQPASCPVMTRRKHLSTSCQLSWHHSEDTSAHPASSPSIIQRAPQHILPAILTSLRGHLSTSCQLSWHHSEGTSAHPASYILTSLRGHLSTSCQLYPDISFRGHLSTSCQMSWHHSEGISVHRASCPIYPADPKICW